MNSPDPGSINCNRCGSPLLPGDRFCAKCGAEATACGQCGEPLNADDRFCAKCGATALNRSNPTPGRTPQTGPGSAAAWGRIVARLREATSREFDIQRELGRGGMAAVYLAREFGLNREVAIKVMSPGLLLDDGMVERFRQEAITLANLNHANIVPIYSVREVEDLHFFVMKYIQGSALDEIVKKAGPLPISLVRAILAQVGSALATAHRKGIIHRDIKPANILMDIDGNAIVTDFGIAKAMEAPSTTRTGTIGTPAYMSPEQCNAAEITPASDQYSLGIVAYELLLAHPPFSGAVLTVMRSHAEKAPPSIRAARPDCPPDLESAILRMLEKDAAHRWPTIGQAVGAIGGTYLSDDDPRRAALAALASGEIERAMELERQAPQAIVPPGPLFTPVPRPGPVVPPIPPRDDTPVKVVINAPLTRVISGETLELSATVVNTAGNPVPQAISWQSEDPLVVQVSATGLLTGRRPGTATVVAHSGPLRAAQRITVEPASVFELQMSGPPSRVTAGDSFTLTATALDRHGKALDGRRISWSSSDRSVATVSSAGAVKALEHGALTITAECEGRKAGTSLVVIAAPVAQIEIAGQPRQIRVGKPFRLAATPEDAMGKALHRPVAWHSSEPSVATVSPDGQVVPLAPGTTIVEVVAAGQKSALAITVLPAIVRAPRPNYVALLQASLSRLPKWWPIASGAAVLVLVGGVWLAKRPRQLAPQPPPPVAVPPAAPDPVPPSPPVLDTVPPRLRGDAQTGGVGRVVSVDGLPRDTTIGFGESFRLRPRFRDARGLRVNDAVVDWRSNNSRIVRVDSRSGVVTTSRDTGTTRIVGRIDSLSLMVTVHVRPRQQPIQVVINPPPPPPPPPLDNRVAPPPPPPRPNPPAFDREAASAQMLTAARAFAADFSTAGSSRVMALYNAGAGTDAKWSGQLRDFLKEMKGSASVASATVTTIDAQSGTAEMELNVSYADPVVRGTKVGKLRVRVTLSYRQSSWVPFAVTLLRGVPS